MEIYNPIDNFESMTINHKDGNKKNNDLSNLEWVSVQDNIAHAYQNNLINIKNSKNGMNKLLEGQANEIIYLYNTTTLSQREIGAKFGISQTEVSRIIRGVRRSDTTIPINPIIKKKKPVCTQTEINKIIELYLQGEKQYIIAKQLNLGLSTVERYIAKYKKSKL